MGVGPHPGPPFASDSQERMAALSLTGPHPGTMQTYPCVTFCDRLLRSMRYDMSYISVRLQSTLEEGGGVGEDMRARNSAHSIG